MAVQEKGRDGGGARRAQGARPPPPPRTKWTRLVPLPVLTGHGRACSPGAGAIQRRKAPARPAPCPESLRSVEPPRPPAPAPARWLRGR